MPFFNNSKLPPELRDLTPEALTERLTKAEATAAEAVKFKADYEAADTERQAFKADIERLKAESVQRQQEREQIVTQEEPQQRQGPITDVDWLTNPEEAFNRKMAPLAAATVMNGAMTAKLTADGFIRSQGPDEARLWNKYSKDVENIVNQLPAEQRIFPQTWLNQFAYVKGIKMHEIVKESRTAGSNFFSEGASNSGEGVSGGGDNKEVHLTEQQLKIVKATAKAKNKGFEPTDYIARLKAMRVSNG